MSDFSRTPLFDSMIDIGTESYDQGLKDGLEVLKELFTKAINEKIPAFTPDQVIQIIDGVLEEASKQL